MINDYRKLDKLYLEHKKMSKRTYLKLYLISKASSNK